MATPGDPADDKGRAGRVRAPSSLGDPLPRPAARARA
jgi:hypothetical protein